MEIQIKSFAQIPIQENHNMYYYSNGRPANERKLGLHSTIFRKRPEENEPDGNIEFKKLLDNFI